MFEREYILFLKDINECCLRILDYTKYMSLNEFSENILVQDAVLRNLEVMGEAVKNIPEIIKINHPEIEWRKIAGLRDILIHKYFGITIEIIWDMILNKIPELQNNISITINDIK